MPYARGLHFHFTLVGGAIWFTASGCRPRSTQLQTA